MITSNDPVKDEEFELYLEQKYEEKLEDELLKIGYGQKIKALEKMGVDVSLQDTIKLYIEKVGRTFDKVGNIDINIQTVGEVYTEQIKVVKKMFDSLGIQVDNIEDFDKVEKIIHSDDAIEQYTAIKEESKITEENLVKTALKENKNEIIFDNIRFTNENDYNDYVEIFSDNDVKKFLDNIGADIENDEKQIDENNEDEEIMEAIFSPEEMIIRRVQQIMEFKNFQGIVNPDFCNSTIKDLLNEIKDIAPKTGLYKQLLDDKGQLTVSSVSSFMVKYQEEKMVHYIKSTMKNAYESFNDGKEINKKELASGLILIGELKDKNNRKTFVDALKRFKTAGLDLDVLKNQSSIDEEKVMKFYEDTCGEKPNLDDLMDTVIFGDETAEEIKEEKKAKRRICSKKEEIIYGILSAPKVGHMGKAYFEDKENVQKILILYAKFRVDEVNENKSSKVTLENLDGYNINNKKEDANDRTSGIIKKYMLENSKYFEEYLTADGKVDNQKLKELIKSNPAELSSDVDIMYKQIKSQGRRIKKEERKNTETLKSIRDKVKNIESGNQSVNTDELWKEIKSVPKEIISTDMLNKLNKIDPEKFKKTFKHSKIERNVGTDSYRAWISSFTRLGRKFVSILPELITNKETRKIYVPKIKKHFKSGVNRLGKLNNSKKEKIVKKIFNKTNKTKFIGDGKINDIQEDNNSEEKLTYDSTSMQERIQVSKTPTVQYQDMKVSDGNMVKSEESVQEL